MGRSGDELDRLAKNLNAMLERIEALMIGLKEVSDYRDRTPAIRRLPMDHTAFKSWLDRYIDAWRLLDPVAIGDLFSLDVRYAFDPFEEAVVGRPAVVAAWLADPDEPGLLGGRLRGPRDRRRRPRRPRPDALPDRRPAGGRPRVRQRLRVPVRREGRCREFTEYYMRRRPEALPD